MTRVRRHVRCEICGEEPRLEEEDWICLCPKTTWTTKRGYAGTEEDRALLERYGWRMMTDPNGFVYLVGEGNRGVVSLYPDDTWAGGPEEFNELEDFLKWFATGQL